MDADSKGQPLRARGLRPAADDVLLGTDGDGIPWLVFAGPHVEVVVMVAHREEVLSANALVEGDELIGVPFLGLPRVDHILEAELEGGPYFWT